MTNARTNAPWSVRLSYKRRRNLGRASVVCVACLAASVHRASLSTGSKHTGASNSCVDKQTDGLPGWSEGSSAYDSSASASVRNLLSLSLSFSLLVAEQQSDADPSAPHQTIQVVVGSRSNAITVIAHGTTPQPLKIGLHRATWPAD